MASVPPVSLEPGYRLDRYELLCKIGQGGMASVWLARAQGKHGFERLVAVKTVLPEHATDRDFRTMLLDEARIAAGIDHPNVARILDVGEDRDIPYLVMEYVAGESLNRLHRKLGESDQRIPQEIVLRILADACAGLHVAHELIGPDGIPLGIVHRDVSPQNIIVNELGISKLIDFGVAKATGRLGGETATGIIKGKVAYMAPEQALGVPVDRRADVWAIGAIAYYLLVGAPPFDAPNDAARIIRAVTGDPPDPMPSSVPPAIRDVVLKALSREARDRYATAADLRRALEDAARISSRAATTEDVAKFCGEHLAEFARARKKMLDRALAAASDRARAREALAFQPSASGSSPSLDPRGVLGNQEETSAGTIAHGVAVVPPPTRPARRWGMVAAGGLGVLVLVGGAFAIGTRAARGTDAGKTGAAAASAPPPPVAKNAPPAASSAAPSASSSAAPSASTKAPSSAASPRVRPPVVTKPRPPARPGEKTTDDTIF